MPGNKCSNCAAYNFECKYEEAAKVCRLAYDLPAAGPLIHHVRNEGPLKGAYIVPVFITTLQLLHKGMWKVSSREWRKWRASCSECVVQQDYASYIFLIVSSYVPTPTSLKNWERRLIDKPLFETPCRAPFRINPVRLFIAHHHPGVASLLSLV